MHVTGVGWCPTWQGTLHTAAIVVASVTMLREIIDGALWNLDPTTGACTYLGSSSVLTPSHASAPGDGGGRKVHASFNFPA